MTARSGLVDRNNFYRKAPFDKGIGVIWPKVDIVRFWRLAPVQWTYSHKVVTVILRKDGALANTSSNRDYSLATIARVPTLEAQSIDNGDKADNGDPRAVTSVTFVTFVADVVPNGESLLNADLR